jgi:hypothetical protein
VVSLRLARKLGELQAAGAQLRAANLQLVPERVRCWHNIGAAGRPQPLLERLLKVFFCLLWPRSIWLVGGPQEPSQAFTRSTPATRTRVGHAFPEQDIGRLGPQFCRPPCGRDRIVKPPLAGALVVFHQRSGESQMRRRVVRVASNSRLGMGNLLA